MVSLNLGLNHIGEQYVLGARAPMGNANWRGPWDCAEFASWYVFQAPGILFGTQPQNDPVLADAYTGFWGDQAQIHDALRSVAANLSAEIFHR